MHILVLFMAVPILVILFISIFSNTIRERVLKNSTSEQAQKVFTGALILSLVLYVFTCPSPKDKQLTKEEEIEAKIKTCGYVLVDATKKQMLDPDAFKRRDMKWVIKDAVRGTYIMTIYFTSTNAFGGRVPGMISAEMDLNCDVLKVIDQQGF